MRFLFVSSEQLVRVNPSEFKVILDASQSKRLSKVLRLHAGDETLVRVLPTGELFDAKISMLKGNKGELILSPNLKDPAAGDLRSSPYVELSIGMSIIKKKNFELVVQKVSELGGQAITPLEAERSDVRLVSSFCKDSRRLYDITLEACMQSERPVPLNIKEVLSPIDFARKALFDGNKVFVLHEDCEDSVLMRHSEIAQLVKKVESQVKSIKITVLVGPEGGFSQTEIDELKEVGCQIKRLPGFILRAETAAIMIAALFTLN